MQTRCVKGMNIYNVKDISYQICTNLDGDFDLFISQMYHLARIKQWHRQGMLYILAMCCEELISG